MAALLSIIAKDLKLLARDHSALTFIVIAPIIVISVAGFSLANFYGADPSGQTAYDFPIADQDGGKLGREIAERLSKEASVRVQSVADAGEAERLVRTKRAGNALVIPAGTQAALERGEHARLILYTDPVKYLERLNVRVKLLELRDGLADQRRRGALDDLERERTLLGDRLQQLKTKLDDARASMTDVSRKMDAARADAQAKLDAEVSRMRTRIDAQIERESRVAVAKLQGAVDARVGEIRSSVRDYVDALEQARAQFAAWLSELQRQAGRHAGDIPPPPSFPEPPANLVRMLEKRATIELPVTRDVHVEIPGVELPAFSVPEVPAIEVPDLEVPELHAPPQSLEVEEINVTGGPMAINTFDQNVPGFSVTFLLLGMLLGVSLGLLDERDWGTFQRLLAMPTASRNILLGKLLSRFVVGLVQMLVLFAVGYVAFGISLGSEPWALLLPIVAVTFAGTAFGLIVAATAASREAVLPIGSIVIVTMAAVGGCWWPIDLEPRWMRSIALAFPTTWAMDAFNDLMIRRRGVEAALVPTAVMLAYGFAYLAIGLLLFRRRIARA